MEPIEERPAPVRPLDEHDRALVANVHPTDRVNPRPAGRYNLVVIGAGTAGLVTAAGAAGLGAKVALVERALMGGDCLNVGCVPSKALLRCARAAADVRRAGAFGVRGPGDVTVDFPAVMERMRRLRAGISRHDSAARFTGLGVDVFLGDAAFTSRDTVEVDGRRLRFARACIATGARAAVPPIPGLAEAGCLTNETLFSLTSLPRRLGVLGAGPIGCEMAQCFARFGSQVHLVEQSDHVLPREAPRAAAVLEPALRADGVYLHLGTSLARVERTGDGRVLHLEGAATPTVTVDELLVAVGRAPNVENLGLDAAGVAFDRSGVTVDDRLRTTNRRIFAAGDVALEHKFTHTADFAARIVIRNALFFGRARASALVVPWCTYTDPEIARVGLSAAEARRRDIAIDTFTVELDTVDRAILAGETEGFLEVHLRRGTDRIVGATFVGPHAGDMIGELTLAMRANVGLGTIADTIHPYPTIADAIRKAGDAFNKTRLTPRVATVLKTLLKWRR